MVPLILIITLFGFSLGSPVANHYIDNVIHTALPNEIMNEKLEPTHLMDFVYEYHDKTFIGKVKGTAYYTQGTLSGLSQVQRLSDCQGPTRSGRGISINCTLSFDYLKSSYKGHVKYGVLPKVSYDAKANVGPTIISVEVLQEPGKTIPVVKSVDFRQIGDLKTDFTGLGPLNKYMEILEDNYRERVRAEILNVINHRFQYVLNIAVSRVPMPQ